MSYSFSARGATKAEAKENVALKLAEVAQQQPVHQADVDQASAAANSFIDLLDDAQADDKDIGVSVSGSVYQIGNGLNSASVSIHAGFVDKGQAAG